MGYWWRVYNYRMYAPDGLGGGAESATDQQAAESEVDTSTAQDDAAAQHEPAKTFTQADIDRIIAKTIRQERDKAEKMAQQARTEAEKLAKMSAEQRAQHEREQHERELQEREANITRRELRAQALEQLSERGLPSGLADVLNYTDAEQCSASMAAVEASFRAAVQQGVESRLKGTPPKAAQGQAAPDTSKMSDDEYYRSTYDKNKQRR